MTRGLVYWILMLLWLVWAIVWHFGLFVAFAPIGFAVLLFLLLVLLGWQVFGPPVHG